MATMRSPLLRLAARICAVVVALVAQQMVHRQPADLTGWAVLIAAVVLLIATASPDEPVPGSVVLPLRPFRTTRLLWVAATVAALAATTWLSMGYDHPLAALVAWFAMLLCGFLATRNWRVSAPTRVSEPWSMSEAAAVGAVIILAGCLRFLWIAHLPRYIFDDESRVAIFVKQHYDVGIPNPFTMGWNTWSMLGLSLQSMFAPLLGVNTLSLRLFSAVMGTLATFTTYLLARQLFTRRIALLAAVLLAICRTAIDFSRLGTIHAQVMVFETFAFYCWWRAINTGSAASHWWAGVGIGLCLYSYNAGQMVPTLWIGWIVLAAVWRPRQIRAYWLGVGITLAAFVATFFPYLFYATDHFSFAGNWGEFTVMARNRQTMSEALDAWRNSGLHAAAAIFGKQIWLTWLGFGVLPGGSYQLGYRGGGILDEVTAPLFVLGLGIAGMRGRDARYAFLPYWWLLTAFFGSVLTIDAPGTVRLVGILPALAMLAALPLDWLLRPGERSKPLAVVGIAVVAGLLIAAGWDNWRTYFVIFPRGAISPISQLARTVEELPPDSTVLFAGSEEFLRFDREVFLTDFPGLHLEDVAEPAHLLPLHEPIAQPLALLLGPTQLSLAGYARELYPHTEIRDVMSETDNRVLFRMLRFTPEDIAAQSGLRLEAVDTNGGLSTMFGDPFSGEPPLPGDVRRVHWSGQVYWPYDTRVTLRVEANSPVVASLGGTQITSGAKTETSLTSVRGWQPISIDLEGRGPHTLTMSIRDGSRNRTLMRSDFTPRSTRQGLLATYEREGQPVLHVLDPQLNVFAEEFLYRGTDALNELIVHMPFTASWEGALQVATPGTYELDAVGTGAYSIRLDGDVVFDVPDAKRPDPQPVRVSRTLSAGMHPIAVHWDCVKHQYATRRLLQLYWTPPGGERTLISPPHFVPPKGP